MVTRRPTWQNYFRGLTAEVEEAVRSSSSASEAPVMSKTDAKSRLSSRTRVRKTQTSSPRAIGNAEPADAQFAKEADGPKASIATCASDSEKSSIAASDLLHFAHDRRFATILADPPWRFTNRTGKMAPEHKRLSRYGTMTFEEIMALPVEKLISPTAHLYLWCPNALLPQGLDVMKAWGFSYKSNIVWHKVRKDGGSDGRGVGFYFRNVTELILFGVKGKSARTLAPGRRQVNLLATRRREHSRKPDEQYEIIETCSPGPFLELFARGARKGWTSWGNQADEKYAPTWKTYPFNSLVAAE